MRDQTAHVKLFRRDPRLADREAQSLHAVNLPVAAARVLPLLTDNEYTPNEIKHPEYALLRLRRAYGFLFLCYQSSETSPQVDIWCYCLQ